MGKVFDAINKKARAGDIQAPEVLGVEGSGLPGKPGYTDSGIKKRHTGPEQLEQPDTTGWNELLLEIHGSTSGISESLRVLRAQILYPPAGSPPRSILVTSCVPGEGKTFIVANLGIVMAQGLEQHALLVDCDLRRPTLHRWFGLGNEKGLTDHLKHGTGLGSLIQKTGLKKLSVITSGPSPENPSELLGSNRMFSCLAEIISRYDDRFVILDSPPTQVASEISVLSKHADAVLLVIRQGRSKKEIVKKFIEGVGREKFLGTVFNAFEMNFIEARYKRYYGYDGYQYKAY